MTTEVVQSSSIDLLRDASEAYWTGRLEGPSLAMIVGAFCQLTGRPRSIPREAIDARCAAELRRRDFAEGRES